MMGRARRIYNLMIKVNKLFSFLLLHFLSLGELEKAVETLICLILVKYSPSYRYMPTKIISSGIFQYIPTSRTMELNSRAE